jgi:acyl-CoA synthetase (AMP-forming)/AMP-acid ligase II
LGNKRNYNNRRRILEKCAEKLPKFKIPKAIFLVNTFIETPSGKIDKRALLKVCFWIPTYKFWTIHCLQN